jgi:hypothetical protein
MNATAPSGSACRGFALDQLVIADLQQMEATGRYDRCVLLWLQESCVKRALAAETAQQEHSHTRSGHPDRAWVIRVAQQTYSAARRGGRGFDVKQYVIAARTFYQSEATLRAGQLQELLAYMGHPPAGNIKADIPRFAREFYVGLARMSGALQRLEVLGARVQAEEVGRQLSCCIQALRGAATRVTGVPDPLGRELLAAVEEIGRHPQRFMPVSGGTSVESPPAAAIEFEPLKERMANPAKY